MNFSISAKLTELLDSRARYEADILALKNALSLVNNELAALCQPMIDLALQREGKTHGTVDFAVGNRIYRAVSTKTVTWNQEALREMAHRMSWEDAEDFFKITYAMAEADYKAILHPNVKSQLTVARLVKYGEPKVSVKGED
jgi:hypothetical protein